jgi:hypothetical protein
MTPFSMLKAPVMQPFTHKGSWQWRQETAKLMSSCCSILMRGLILTSFKARAMSCSSLAAKAQ